LGHIGEKLPRSETLPSISQRGQATAVQRLGQLDLLKHHASLTAQSRSNHIAASEGKAEMLHTVRERLAPPITGWTRILRCY
jgi:hypothetical protein